MRQTTRKIAAAAAAAAAALGLAACGSSHPAPHLLSVGQAHAEAGRPAVSAAEKRALAPFPRAVRDEIERSGVHFDADPGAKPKIATESDAINWPRSWGRAGEAGYGCEHPAPLAPGVLDHLRSTPNVGAAMTEFPALFAAASGVSAAPVQGHPGVFDVEVTVDTTPSPNQGLVTLAVEGSHVLGLTAQVVTRC